MARSICSSFSQGKAPARADLSELVTLVQCQLADANNSVLAAVNFIVATARAHDGVMSLSNVHEFQHSIIGDKFWH
jgi:hypothetical protein